MAGRDTGAALLSNVLTESFVFALSCFEKLENGTPSLGNGLVAWAEGFEKGLKRSYTPSIYFWLEGLGV